MKPFIFLVAHFYFTYHRDTTYSKKYSSNVFRFWTQKLKQKDSYNFFHRCGKCKLLSCILFLRLNQLNGARYMYVVPKEYHTEPIGLVGNARYEREFI